MVSYLIFVIYFIFVTYILIYFIYILYLLHGKSFYISFKIHCTSQNILQSTVGVQNCQSLFVFVQLKLNLQNNEICIQCKTVHIGKCQKNILTAVKLFAWKL